MDRRRHIEISAGSRTIWAVAFCGEHLVSGGFEGVRVWRVSDGEEIATMPAVGAVRCLAVSRNGRQIASGTVRGEVVLWDGATYQRTGTLKQGHAGVTAVHFSPDNSSAWLVAASEDGRAASIWDTITHQCTLALTHDHRITAAKYSPQGDRIATAASQSIRVWDSEDGRLLFDIPVRVTPWLNTGLVWSDSNQLLIVSDRKIKLIDASTGSSISEWPLPDASNSFPSIALSQHGTFIVSSGKRAITFLNKETHAQFNLVQHIRDIRAVALSPNDQFLAVGGQGGKITIKAHHVLAEPEFYVNDNVLDLWKSDQLVNAESLLTTTIYKSSNPSMCSHILAGRALVRGRLHEWDVALDDAKESIRIEPTVIGFVAKSVALVGKGKRHEAYRACDIALEQFYLTHVGFLLLIKAIIAFMAGDHSDAVARVDDLIATACLNPTYHVVQAHMYLLQGDLHMDRCNYEDAIRLFRRARAQARHHHPDRLLWVISLISGWKFDDLFLTTQLRLCEALYLSGRVKEAGESLLDINADTFGNELYRDNLLNPTTDFMQRCLSTPERGRNIVPNRANGGPMFQLPTPILQEWAKLKLMSNSWKEALLASTAFIVPKFTTYLAICERLESIDYLAEAVECLQQLVSEFAEEAHATDERANWIAYFTLRCAEKSVCFGDTSVAAQKYDDAIAWYSTALSLNPSSPHGVFIKRCKVYLAMGLWRNALDDTNQLMLIDRLSLFRPEVVLEKWASVELTNRSWKETLSNANGFSVPRFAVFRALCDRLEVVDRAMEALECFRQMESELAGDMDVPNERVNWVVDFKRRCAENLQRLGDVAAGTRQYNDAMTFYSTSLSLDPATQQDILVKRCRVYMATCAWAQAIDDMNRVVAIDPLSLWGYEIVLTAWAKAALLDGSWKDALMAAENFHVPTFAVYQSLCECLVALDRLVAATECFHDLERTFVGHPEGEDAKWLRDFKDRCCRKLETLGDAAMVDLLHDEAISLYSVALSLSSSTSLTLHAKRSKAHADKGSWGAARNDADEAILLDPSKPLGYERLYVALHGAGDHAKALGAFETMLSEMSRSTDSEICERYHRYNETRETIRKVVRNAIRESPRVLINTISGRLCNKSEQAATFELLPVFTDLISSMTTGVDLARIIQEVAKYYRYATFSHKWEDNEPLFEKVIHSVVYELDASPTHDKLRRFCEIVRDAGFCWAWSDTCCIDKADNAVVQESLVAMFKWYRGAAVTIAFLRGVCSPSKRGDLVKSIWNTRAWTFQEYHASKVVRFYTEDWVPYRNLDMPNHKESPEVISEMEEATGVSAEALMKLQPGLDHIREKLRLASTRQTTRIEDAAYSLLGIFSASVPPNYGEGHEALGRLLAHVLAASGDLSILAWTGESSTFNSCLPAHITVFDGPCSSHFPRHIDNVELDKMVTTLRTSPTTVDAALLLYDRLCRHALPWFAAKRMLLPCLAFGLPTLSCNREPSGILYYRVETRTFGTVGIRTREKLPRQNPLFLVHPWLVSLFDEEMHSATNSFMEDVQEPSGSPSATDDDGDNNDGEDSDGGGDGEDDHDKNTEDDQSSPSSRPASPERGPIDRETCALRLVARLRQPFGALLLVQTFANRRMVYRRVAADTVITVRIQDNIALDKLVHNVCELDVL